MYIPGYLPETIAVLEGIRSFRNDASGIFIHKNYNILVKGSVFADNNIGMDVDRAEGIEIEDTIIIGESESYRKLMARQNVGPVCSSDRLVGVDLHTWTIFKGHGGSKWKNVVFQGFSNTACPMPRAINMDNHVCSLFSVLLFHDIKLTNVFVWFCRILNRACLNISRRSKISPSATKTIQFHFAILKEPTLNQCISWIATEILLRRV
jgi:hypothetical protein